ncbi:transposon-transfer assisting family protein [[Clostridium] innocuum]|uniref:transposon-transfer assisting family protein n=1 Tax=Clostridium innocuum TaxID=1522 RepID=UPI000C2F9D7F|nr:transposon-transfer assisting family protein [[Clostridium] innocuum]MCR0176105.1 transposon-transfer assisting family protein [[Clostridium] innocuum]MCR0642921.1 transposon-transfer assisting family protein [[Clostridium] innocuum]
MDFTHDEKMLLMIYGQDTKEKTIKELNTMKAQLTFDEKELRTMTETLIKKIQKISETQYSELRFYPQI